MPETRPANSTSLTRRLLRNHGVFFSAVGKPYLRAMVIPAFVLLLGVAMADAVTDWAALRLRIAALGDWPRTALIGALLVAWAGVAGRTLGQVWYRPVLRFLARQPIGPWHWVAYLYPSVGVALLPVAGIAWLAPASIPLPMHYVGFMMLAWPIVIGASFRGRDAVVTGAIAASIAIAALVLYGSIPVTGYAVFFPAALASRAAVAPIRRQLVQLGKKRYEPLSGSGVLATILRRDLRYLSRAQRGRLAGHYLWVLLCVLMMLAFRVNGEIFGRDALLSACIWFSLSIYSMYEILESLKLGLGKELMRRRWPVSSRQRAAALIALAVILAGPGAVAILMLGSSMGVGNGFAFAMHVAIAIGFSSGLLAALLLVQSSSNGLFLLGLVANVIAVIALEAWTYSLLAIVAVAMAVRFTIRGLDQFTTTTERVSLDQLA